ncbi:alpha/beta hydrolase [Mucilaginibacter sp. PAMB04274]|uniref:alpha/beta fold hydrolase n=1 Tax=Mucilaginibacter sp. PAMB04274 TaxID=3138568 RepID=UPI0031F6A6E1
MQLNSIIIENYTITYHERNSEANETVFFIHGNSNSSLLWDKQLNDEQLQSYRLIAIDLPGHGESSHAENPVEDYTIIKLGGLMYNTINQLSDGKPFIVCGFSLGSNVVAEMLTFDLRPKGIILVSPSIVGQALAPATIKNKAIIGEVLFGSNITQKKLDEYLQLAIPDQYHHERGLLQSDYLRTDHNVRVFLMKNALKGIFSDEVALVNLSELSCLMIIGLDDEITSPDSYDAVDLFTAKVNFIKLDSTGHFIPLESPKRLSNLVKMYADETF